MFGLFSIGNASQSQLEENYAATEPDSFKELTHSPGLEPWTVEIRRRSLDPETSNGPGMTLLFLATNLQLRGPTS